MIARLAYLTSPSPNRYILNFQEEGKDELCRLEISEGHLANIIITGTSLALRKTFVANRVPELQPVSAENERAAAGT
jgi:hypothetical protein